MPRAACNGFSVFAETLRPRMEEQVGRSLHRFNDLVRVAAPYWNRLNDDDKRGWKTRARDYKSSAEFANRRRDAKDRSEQQTASSGGRYMMTHNPNYNPRKKNKTVANVADEFAVEEDDDEHELPGMIVGETRQDGANNMFQCLPNGDFTWNNADADPIEQRELSDKFGLTQHMDRYEQPTALSMMNRPHNYQPAGDIVDMKGNRGDDYDGSLNGDGASDTESLLDRLRSISMTDVFDTEEDCRTKSPPTPPRYAYAPPTSHRLPHNGGPLDYVGEGGGGMPPSSYASYMPPPQRPSNWAPNLNVGHHSQAYNTSPLVNLLSHSAASRNSNGRASSSRAHFNGRASSSRAQFDGPPIDALALVDGQVHMEPRALNVFPQLQYQPPQHAYNPLYRH